MKRTLMVAAVLSALCVSLVFAQAGPKREEKKKSKPDTTSVAKPEKKEEPAKKEQPQEKEGAEKKEKTGKKTPAEKKKPVEMKEAPEKAAPVEKKEVSEKKEMPEPKPALTPPAPMESPDVPRAVITGAMAGREPTAPVDTLVAPADSVYFFTELVGMKDRTVTHRWKLDGEVMAEVPISVRASRWRAYSKKRLIPAWAGAWTVEVVDAGGNVVARKSFVYRAR